MRTLYVISALLLGCIIPQLLHGQISDLTSSDSAVERIQRFFLDADNTSDRTAFSFEASYVFSDSSEKKLDSTQLVLDQACVSIEKI
jgi:hypothetical protein